ncbi:low-density lipoprotein receptor-related protein 4-like isoform X2 [Mytilus californianus]|uniref:low-density lipoprotein receptor-related protein 4-like isoform X2 n=1 Tax=Mytilus californianus TaxID=6549 RepID=UPI00224528DB|nr:low-density lipoprotein receptor-related protein 4-like isoform X2 [Mytilus californianus]
MRSGVFFYSCNNMGLHVTWFCLVSMLYMICGIVCFEKKLLFSTSTGYLKDIDLETGVLRLLGNADSGVFALAYDKTERYIYVPRFTSGDILRFPYPNNKTIVFESVVSGNQPGGIAFDSANSHLYWTEPKEGNIMRCNSDGSNVITIINGTGTPAALTIDIANRWMYYSQDISNGTLQRLTLDGKESRVIDNQASWVYGICIDDQRLYWMDNLMGDLKSAWYNGSDVETIVSTNSTKRNWDIDINDDFIFYTSNTTILKTGKSPGQNLTVVHTDTDQITGILFYKQEAYLVK